MQMVARPALPEIKAGDVWNLIKNRKEDSAEEAVEMTVNETQQRQKQTLVTAVKLEITPVSPQVMKSACARSHA